MASDNTTKHAGWMPGSPSMNQGGSLSDFEDPGSAAGDGITKHAGDYPKGADTSMSDSGDMLGTHIMEGDYDSLFPGSNQGNLEPLKGSGVKGT